MPTPPATVGATGQSAGAHQSHGIIDGSRGAVRTLAIAVAGGTTVVAFAAPYVAINSIRPTRALELVALAALLDVLWLLLTFGYAETL